MNATERLKAYCCGQLNPDEGWCEFEVIAASSPEEAARIYWPDFGDTRIGLILKDDDEGYAVRRMSSLDAHVRSKPEILDVTAAQLRAAGWASDGEPSCDLCGLSAMGLDEFHVCRSCCRCKECDHAEGCAESSP